jgi:hypothetical protein
MRASGFPQHRLNHYSAQTVTFVQPVDSFHAVEPPENARWHTAAGPNQSKSQAMPIKARNIVLTRSQAACLIALQHGKHSKSKVAIDWPDKTKQAEHGARRPAGKVAITRPFQIVRAAIEQHQVQAVAAPCIVGPTDARERDRRKIRDHPSESSSDCHQVARTRICEHR